MTQPLVAYLCVSAAIGRHDAISIVTLLIYMLTFIRVRLPASIRPTKECPHLNFDWWPYWRAIAYNITTLIVLRSLPTKDMLIHGAIFEVTLLFSIATVKPCGVASVWCWSTFVAAIIVLLVSKLTKYPLAQNRTQISNSLFTTLHSHKGVRGYSPHEG